MPTTIDRLPESLKPLEEIAYSLWWSWSTRGRALFERALPNAYRGAEGNPVRALVEATPEELARAAVDRGILEELNEVYAAYRADVTGPARCGAGAGGVDGAPAGFKVAYFCAEFGLSECFPIYCGGLGLLAGDHLKSASQLGLPLIAVGLMYSHGYFRQVIDGEGVQEEHAPTLNTRWMPMRPVIDPVTNQQRRVHVELPGRWVAVGIWRCMVGRVPLYLLDTDMPENSPEDRTITRNLYLGDHNQRIKQEIVLGIGGVRALDALGERPTVFHMNEGHAAFLALERISAVRRRRRELSFDQAREAVAPAHVFTTHTPLPAGIDRFHPELVAHYLGGMLKEINLDLEGFLALGRERVENAGEHFSMAVLALRCARFANGVSKLHGHVSRAMWKGIWPGIPERDVPIGSVTNGVHTDSWLAPELRALYAETLGDRSERHPDDVAAWREAGRIPDERLWKAKASAKARLIGFCRARAVEHPGTERGTILDPERFTIGFARRFAPYKRATLLFRDPERLKRILASSQPLQIIISGKAHPGDHGGKSAIQKIIQLTREHGLARHVVFVPDYDIEVARHLVQGADLWLNNPIRGLEASGTSGMKAAMNGTVNASILDGWWDEGYTPEVGFAIGSRDADPEDTEARDDAQSRALFELLEKTILPEYYRRDSAGMARAWLARCKRCVAALAPEFSTHRMVSEYARTMYYPAHEAAARMTAEEFAPARSLSDRVDAYRKAWRGLSIREARLVPAGPGQVRAEAVIELGGLMPADVRVEFGDVVDVGQPGTGQLFELASRRDGAEAVFASGPIEWSRSLVEGAGIGVRVLPRDDRMVHPMIPGLVATRRVSASAAELDGHADV